jgi:hypothetical protein
LAWIALYLLVIEIALEHRAARRGWATLLWPAARSAEPGRGGAGGQAASPEFGPTESFAFRSRVVDPHRPPGVKRVWIASSSHAEDTAVAAEQVFPNVLERELAEAGRPAQVINASRAGQTLAGHVALAGSQGDRWSPDVVVLYQMSNDIALLSRLEAEGAGAGGGEAGGGGGGGSPGLPWAWTDRLLERSSTWPLLKTNVTSVLTAQRLLSNELGAGAEAAFAGQARQFVRFWKSRGAEVALCTFALSHDRSNRDRMPLDTVRTIFRHSAHLSIDGWIGAVDRLNGVLRRVAGEEGAAVIDVGAAVGGRSEWFRDFVHFTPRGHAQVARAIARSLGEGAFAAAGDSP